MSTTVEPPLLQNPAIQFLIVVLIVCSIAIGACFILEKCLKCFYPVTDHELGRVMYVKHEEPSPVTPRVIITVEPPEFQAPELVQPPPATNGERTSLLPPAEF